MYLGRLFHSSISLREYAYTMDVPLLQTLNDHDGIQQIYVH